MKTIQLTKTEALLRYMERNTTGSTAPRLPMPVRDNETFVWITLAAACASALSLVFL